MRLTRRWRGELRPGNAGAAGANTAEDQIMGAEHAIEQIPLEHIQDIELLLLRVDSAAQATGCWTGAMTDRSAIRWAMS
jgi:hypothetical protein